MMKCPAVVMGRLVFVASHVSQGRCAKVLVAAVLPPSLPQQEEEDWTGQTSLPTNITIHTNHQVRVAPSYLPSSGSGFLQK